jgi:dinuclear metal center YbgI/SA1388 family protein
MADRDAIVALLDETLKTAEIKDSSCNGLQVQGAGEVRRVGLAVDACLEAYEKAAAEGAQMLIVHHGLIWNGIRSVTGRHYNHIRFLLEHDLNLYASHLPLDMHAEHGNNIQLARALELQEIKPFGNYHEMVIGYQGVLAKPTPLQEVADRLTGPLGGKPLLLGNGPEKIRSVGIVSGGAGDMIDQAADARLDCYITGEPMHFGYQLSRELGSNVIYLGHYHSEKLGVQAIGRLLTEKLGVESVFLEIGAFSAGEYTD